ncbi:OLC1v1018726C1 [Oldenlandia corymbosa var. corymbosa]|uniref:OLC1v1018726C1 n=1 Tax=Oldenlandia corymbosa var. corymbosa TaxID=529605 RepID=A0AAV1ECD6_OLDCO|nr:OLC1v1018726C1 [Oldenlandia corymbosa var. corymbosa]
MCIKREGETREYHHYREHFQHDPWTEMHQPCEWMLEKEQGQQAQMLVDLSLKNVQPRQGFCLAARPLHKRRANSHGVAKEKRREGEYRHKRQWLQDK